MPMIANNVITYSDVINHVTDKIVKACANADKFTSDVHYSLKNQTSFTLIKDTVSPKGQNAYINVKVNDALGVTVSSSTIKNQLNDFLTTRGVKTQSNKPISMKGMMNLYNNIATFITRRLVVVNSSFNIGKQLIFYNATSNLSYNAVNFGNFNELNFNSTEMQACINNLMNSLNQKVKVKYINTVITNSCSSSSSSSSSSCSSSSSSSSMFIAYMDI